MNELCEMIGRDQCVVCGELSEWKRVTTLPKTLFRRHAKIVRCSYCGVGRTIPAPDTSIAFYENNDRNDELFTQRAEIYRRFSEELLSHLESIAPSGGKLLDFGCGGGFIVESAARFGYKAEGIEANLAMVNWCQSRGLNVHSKSIDELIDEKAQYNVIVFSAVLEHLSDPYSVLVSCKQLLAPSGVMVISQASYDGLLPRIFPWGWYGWQPLEHYWHFTPKSLRLMSQRMGMSAVKLVRGNLYHPWFKRGSLLELAGRNLAALLARVGLKMGMGDNIYYVIRECSIDLKSNG